MITYLLIALLCLVWGATWVVIKIGLQDSPPFWSAIVRFLIALVVLAGIVWIKKKPHPRGLLMWWRVLLPGIFMYTIPYASVYYAEQHISAAMASVLFATFPFFVAILAHFYLPGEQLNLKKGLGLLVGFVGIIVIFNDSLSVPDPRVIPSMLITLLSPASAALASIWLKKYLTKVDSVSATMWQTMVGVAFLLPLGFGLESFADFHWTAKAVGAAAFLGIFGSAMTFVIYLHLLKTEEATKLSLIAFVTPFVAVLLGWILLNESLSLVAILGGALVLLGVYGVLIWAPRRAGG